MKVIVFGFLVVFLLNFFIPINSAIETTWMPRLEQINAIVESDPVQTWELFKAGKFDFYSDVFRVHETLDEANLLGHQTFGEPGFHVCYIGINCRDYVPNDAEQPDQGRELAPLNWSSFRRALAWAALSLEQTEQAVIDIYGAPTYYPAYTIIPEQLGIWHNPNVTSFGGNFTEAWKALKSAGFNITNNLLYQPNGVLVREQIQLIVPGPPPVLEFCERYCIQWNDFFDNFLNVTNCNIVKEYFYFSTIVERAFTYRNFDMYFLCWGLSRFPDYLYDFFHSSQDGPGLFGNSPGIHNGTLDGYLETIEFGFNFSEKYQACWEAQKLLDEELVPYIYLYHRSHWTIVRGTPNSLQSIVNVKGIGIDNDWTWMHMHWLPPQTEGSVNYIMEYASALTLHPGWADSDIETWILDRIADGLTATTPELLDMPWMAVDWQFEPFELPSLGIYDGVKITFHVRDGVYWHDGWPVTAEDIKFSLEFMGDFPRLLHLYVDLLWVDVDDPNTVTAYFDLISPFEIFDFNAAGLLFPKHIYDQTLHPTRDSVFDSVWTIDWATWMADYVGLVPEEVLGWVPGDAAPSGLDLTALVGCGPYYFAGWNETTATVVLKRDPWFWVQSSVVCGMKMPGRVEVETDTPSQVLICNVGAIDDVTGTFKEVQISSFEILVEGEVKFIKSVDTVIDAFCWETFTVPQWVLNHSCGYNNVTVVVYELGNPVEPISVSTQMAYFTREEDITYDFYVGIDDIVECAKSFGAAPPPFPGNKRWEPEKDLNADYYVGIDDIVTIVEAFGWEC